MGVGVEMWQNASFGREGDGQGSTKSICEDDIKRLMSDYQFLP